MSSNRGNSNPTPPGDHQWLELLSAYVDGEVSPTERAEVEALLSKDPAARLALEEFQSLHDTLQSVPHEQAPSGLQKAVLEATRQPGAGGRVRI
ncbi:MAG: zf-HC2 domain-containing protein, partial [Planctomycetales bacterium]|nr:zf-HC2 domain-containing protein [Planctomycetales bacterium]